MLFYGQGSQFIEFFHRQGKGEIEHHKEIPEDTLNAIWDLCAKLEYLLEARDSENYEAYMEALDQIPFAWKHKYHELLRICIQFLLTLLDIRRGNEGLELLTKEHFELMEEAGIKFYKKVRFP